MVNRIHRVVVTDHRLDLAESEIHIAVYPEWVTPGTEIRGRLTGPSHPYASTVEIPYYLREVSRSAESILLRAVIPEPCFWDPQQPFLYQGPLELWQDQVPCEQARLVRGLRKARLSACELRLNGRPVVLRGTYRVPQSEDEARSLHADGYNLILLRTAQETARQLAERFGFLALLHCAGARGDLLDLTEHRGLVLWEVPPAVPGEAPVPRWAHMGVELHVRPAKPFPYGDISFVLCDEQALPALTDINLPKLALVDRLPAREAAAPSGIVGWVEREANDEPRP